MAMIVLKVLNFYNVSRQIISNTWLKKSESILFTASVKVFAIVEILGIERLSFTLSSLV